MGSFILTHNLQGKTASLLQTGMSPSNTAKALNADPEVQALLTNAPRKAVRSGDIREYQEQLGKQGRAEIYAMVAKEKTTQEMTALVHQRVSSLADRAGQFDGLMGTLLSDIAELRERSMSDDRTLCAECNAELTPYPLKHIDTALKAAKEIREIVNHIQTDKGLQQYIKTGSLTVNNGMSMDEAFDLCIRIGRVLGHSDAETMRAFAEARQNPKGLPVDVVDVKADSDVK